MLEVSYRVRDAGVRDESCSVGGRVEVAVGVGVSWLQCGWECGGCSVGGRMLVAE